MNCLWSDHHLCFCFFPTPGYILYNVMGSADMRWLYQFTHSRHSSPSNQAPIAPFFDLWLPNSLVEAYAGPENRLSTRVLFMPGCQGNTEASHQDIHEKKLLHSIIWAYPSSIVQYHHFPLSNQHRCSVSLMLFWTLQPDSKPFRVNHTIKQLAALFHVNTLVCLSFLSSSPFIQVKILIISPSCFLFIYLPARGLIAAR